MTMRTRLTWIVLAVAALVALVLVYRSMTKAPRVEVIAVEAGTVERVLAAVGRVRAEDRVSVFPRAAGLITRLQKNEGDLVKAGDILGEIDAGQSRAILKQRQASTAGQRRQLAQSERDFARAQSLLDKGFTTKAAYESARLQVQRDREEILRLEAAETEAKSRLEDFVIRAPMDGRIVFRPVDAGQVVTLTTQVFELVSQTPPEVETDVDETLAGAIKVGMAARIAPAGMEGKSFTGKVTFVSPRIEPTTGGRTIRFSFEASPKDIPTGLSADVNISVETRQNAIAIPRTSIGDASRAPFVLLIREGKLARQDITFIDWPAERVIVTTGLKPDDLLALDPIKVAPGTAVTAMPAPAPK
jgi:RND family efflux transporter MFP subunit